MDAVAVQSLLESFQQMAKSNQELVQAVKAGQTAPPTEPTATNNGDNQTANDSMGAVALTGIKVPFSMGDSAEEKLINFHKWKEEVNDKLDVAGVLNQQRRATVALMWGGRDIKEFAVEQAGVALTTTTTADADGWDDATIKIERKMEEGINEAFAMFKFRQNEQGHRGLYDWYKQLKASVKTLRLKQCTCGLGYSEERAIRDVIVALTTDNKLRKDALSKDLALDKLLKEGEANELARARAAALEKSVNKIELEDEELTEEEAQYMIAKLKRAGKYSTKYEKQEKSQKCDRCVDAKTAHSPNNCFFKDKECHACKEKGHMKGAKRCSKTKCVRKLEKIETDYNDRSNWESETNEDSKTVKNIEIKKVNKNKNVVRVKVGEVETDMYTDSGSDVSTMSSNWYRKGMGTLVPTNDILRPYGSSEGLPVEAKFKTTITTAKGAKEETWVYVVNSKEDIQPLLGDDVATELGFLTFQPEGRNPTKEENEQHKVLKVSSNVQIGSGAMPDSKNIPKITQKEVTECWDIPKYESVFDPKRIGTMKNRKPIILHRNEEKRIISQPYRPIAPQLEEELSDHLQFLRDNKKIVDVDPNVETVESYSNVVLSRKKNGDIRMNLDARPVNEALRDIVSPHMVTPDNVRHKLSGSTRFSEFDMNHGYNQSTLSEESSRKYGVFQTHEGFHRFVGLYFGHKQASQAFDADVKTSLRGLKQSESVADNIMVHGRTAEEHKKGLIDFLDRCVAEGITLALHKVTVCQKELLWFGYVFGVEGVRPDPMKVQKLKEKGIPENQEEVRSFLQAAQFNARFMWDTEGAYSHITQPLRKLLGKNSTFEWGPKQHGSYSEIINAGICWCTISLQPRPENQTYCRCSTNWHSVLCLYGDR